MKKLKLQIEKLCVEQFEVHPDSPVTVQSFGSHSCGGTNPWGGFCICQENMASEFLSECC
jgi:hypothetical protein